MTKADDRAVKSRAYQKKYQDRKMQDPEYRKKRADAAKQYYYKKKNDPEFVAKVNARNLKQYYDSVRPNPEKLEHRRTQVKGYMTKVRQKHQEKRRELQQLLGGKCVDCGLTEWRLLDFDHKEPKEKLMNISQQLHQSVESLVDEVKKCELRCPNCHRLKTVAQGGHDGYKLRAYRNERHREFKALTKSGPERKDNRIV